MKKIGYQVRGAKRKGGFMSEQKQQEMLIEPKANFEGRGNDRRYISLYKKV